MEVESQGGFWLVLAMMILLFPFSVTAGVVMAAAVHEMGHILAIRISGGRVRRLVLRSGGATLQTDPMTPGRELFCALAGPAAGMLTLTLWRIFPEISVAGLIQTVFNLLPIYPLDGGRVRRAAGELFWIGRGGRIGGSK